MMLKDFKKKILSLLPGKNEQNYQIIETKKYFFSFILLVAAVFIYIFFSNQISTYKDLKQNNFAEIIESDDFLKVKKYIFNNLQSPYAEYKYIIKNNDNIEKILENFNVKNDEIKKIVNKLKSKKLSNIYIGRNIDIVLKKNEGDKNSIINIVYPVSNTLTIEIRKENESFLINKNVVKLNKKEVVVRNTIDNNLYNAAVEVGIEPNIIVEFARIYGFEIDFQRDIRKGDWFEIYYEKFLDENEIVRDTGKILFASMFVNNKEINLYNFKNKNETG